MKGYRDLPKGLLPVREPTVIWPQAPSSWDQAEVDAAKVEVTPMTTAIRIMRKEKEKPKYKPHTVMDIARKIMAS